MFGVCNGTAGARIRRHNMVVKALAAFMRERCDMSVTEELKSSAIDGRCSTNHRLDVIGFSPEFPEGVGLDATVIIANSATALGEEEREAGGALKAAERRKARHYRNHGNEMRVPGGAFKFSPFAVSHTGGIGPGTATDQIAGALVRAARAVAHRRGLDEEEEWSAGKLSHELRSTVAVAVANGNALVVNQVAGWGGGGTAQPRY